MIIDEVKKNVAKRLLGKKSYIAGIGLLVLQQQNNKGEAYLTKKEKFFTQFWKLESSRSKTVLVHLLIRHLFLVCRSLSSSYFIVIPISLCLSKRGGMAEEDRRNRNRKEGEGRKEVLKNPGLSELSSILVKL